MNNNEMMVGYWYTLFSDISDINEVQITIDQPLERIVECFNDKTGAIESLFSGTFDKNERVRLAEHNYIRFPDFKFDNDAFEKLKASANLRLLDLQAFSNIDTIRLDINPCIAALLEGINHSSKNKIPL